MFDYSPNLGLTLRIVPAQVRRGTSTDLTTRTARTGDDWLEREGRLATLP
jgi:hypothetical protein